jgi:hypothetical protein
VAGRGRRLQRLMSGSHGHVRTKTPSMKTTWPSAAYV